MLHPLNRELSQEWGAYPHEPRYRLNMLSRYRVVRYRPKASGHASGRQTSGEQLTLV